MSAEPQLKPCLKEKKSRSMSLLKVNVMAYLGCQLHYICNQLNPSTWAHLWECEGFSILDLWEKIHPKYDQHLLVTVCIKVGERKEAFAFCRLAFTLTDKFTCPAITNSFTGTRTYLFRIPIATADQQLCRNAQDSSTRWRLLRHPASWIKNYPALELSIRRQALLDYSNHSL